MKDSRQYKRRATIGSGILSKCLFNYAGVDAIANVAFGHKSF